MSAAMLGVIATDLAKMLKNKYLRIFWWNLKKSMDKFWKSGEEF